jgi:tight adherence protein B
MNINLFVTSTFLAAIFCVLAVYSVVSDLVFRDRMKLQSRIHDELRGHQRDRARRSILRSLSQEELHKLIATADDSRTWKERLDDLMDQAGLHWTLQQFFGLSAGVAFSVFLPALFISKRFSIAIACGCCATILPLLYVRFQKNRRQNTMREQLADAFELMSSTLRAGQSMTQSMQAVAADFPAPISEEFMLCSEQQNLGLDPEIAMRQLARRCGIIELKIFVVAVLVQRQVGGNLSEILQGLAHIVRDRFRIMGLIETLTAEGRLQAAILMALPPFLLVVMMVMNREYTQSLLDNPQLLVGMGVSMLLGWLWIRKIVNFDF